MNFKDEKKHGDVIKKYHDLNQRLNKYNLLIDCWGRIGISPIDNRYAYIANNLDTIEEAEQWFEGFKYGISKNIKNHIFGDLQSIYDGFLDKLVEAQETGNIEDEYFIKGKLDVFRYLLNIE